MGAVRGKVYLPRDAAIVASGKGVEAGVSSAEIAEVARRSQKIARVAPKRLRAESLPGDIAIIGRPSLHLVANPVFQLPHLEMRREQAFGPRRVPTAGRSSSPSIGVEFLGGASDFPPVLRARPYSATFSEVSAIFKGVIVTRNREDSLTVSGELGSVAQKVVPQPFSAFHPLWRQIETGLPGVFSLSPLRQRAGEFILAATPFAVEGAGGCGIPAPLREIIVERGERGSGTSARLFHCGAERTAVAGKVGEAWSTICLAVRAGRNVTCARRVFEVDSPGVRTASDMIYNRWQTRTKTGVVSWSRSRPRAVLVSCGGKYCGERDQHYGSTRDHSDPELRKLFNKSAASSSSKAENQGHVERRTHHPEERLNPSFVMKIIKFLGAWRGAHLPATGCATASRWTNISGRDASKSNSSRPGPDRDATPRPGNLTCSDAGS